MAMTTTRFKEIMEDKRLTISTKEYDDNCVALTINPLYLDEICGYADNNGFGFSYDEQAIRNHTMEVDIYTQSDIA